MMNENEKRSIQITEDHMRFLLDFMFAALETFKQRTIEAENKGKLSEEIYWSEFVHISEYEIDKLRQLWQDGDRV